MPKLLSIQQPMMIRNIRMVCDNAVRQGLFRLLTGGSCRNLPENLAATRPV